MKGASSSRICALPLSAAARNIASERSRTERGAPIRFISFSSSRAKSRAPNQYAASKECMESGPGRRSLRFKA